MTTASTFVKLLAVSVIVVLSGCKSNDAALSKHVFTTSEGRPLAGLQFGCKTVVNASIWQDGPEDKGRITTQVEEGTDQLAVTVNEDSISLITGASVGGQIRIRSMARH